MREALVEVVAGLALLLRAAGIAVVVDIRAHERAGGFDRATLKVTGKVDR
jgi:hypothetical protein